MSTSTVAPQPVPLAVVGLGALFPGSADVGGFWRDILAGRDRITDVPPTHWLVDDYYDPDPKAADRTYGKRGAFLSDVAFDPMAYGMPPSILPATDTVQLLALVVAQQVLADATRGGEAGFDRERTSVILGMTGATELVVHLGARLQRPIWAKALRESGLSEAEVEAACERIADHYVPWQESSFPGLLGNVVAGRIANRFDLGGTNCVVDAACASSLSALSMGAMELYTGASDLVITGGADALNDVLMFMCFSKTPALSPTGDCRPFSADADGTLLGEGFGMVALRRLADAERDGNRIYAVVRGVGSSSDGRAKSVYAPRPEGQVRAYRNAYAAAGFGPETVELVEAHGTATKAGDAAEFASLTSAFEATGREDRQWCALGSIKSQIGHTKSAAGVAGLIKAVLALHHRALPPTIKVGEPSPKLEVERSPFYLSTRLRPWIRGGEHPRRAGVSAFGFGGSNFHVALEEYTGAAPRPGRIPALPTHLLLFSAATPEELRPRLAAAVERAAAGRPLFDVARASFRDFDPALPARLAVVAADAGALRDAALRVDAHLAATPAAPLSLPGAAHYALGAEPGKVAFLFPGQGSQYVGMGEDLALAFDATRGVWDEHADLGLHGVVFPRPPAGEAASRADAERLRATEWAQPAIVAASLSQLALLDALGMRPDRVGGHSLGELTALSAAGVLEPGAALRAARRRGVLMAAAASTPGAMLAVLHAAGPVERLLGEAGVEVVVANRNGPRQIVLSGGVEPIVEAERLLREAGIEARRLPVATAFHSPLVAPATAPFRDFLEGVDFAAPALPVHANVDAAPYPEDAAGARDTLARQIAAPVRFAEQVEAMLEAGVRTFVEVGPGSVLTGLALECAREREEPLEVVAVALDRRGRHGVTSLQVALARLAVAGVRFDAGALLREYEDEGEDSPPALSPATVFINGSNYAKPYPPRGSSTVPKSDPPRATAAEAAAPPSERLAVPAAYANGSHATGNGNGSGGHAAPPPAPPALPAAPSAEAQAGWFAAFHAFQRSVADAHMAYLRTAETGWLALQSLQGQGAAFAPPALPPRELPAPPSAPFAALAPPAQAYAPTPAAYAPAPYAAPAPAPPAYAPAPMPPAPPAPPAQAYAPPPPPPAPAPAPPAAPAAPAPPAPAAEPLDMAATLLAVVAEKTGYPPEMLQLEMDLESDLGIDSIKRVEILAALQERVEDMPPVDPDEMARLRTLSDIVEYMEQFTAAGGVSPGNP